MVPEDLKNCVQKHGWILVGLYAITEAVAWYRQRKQLAEDSDIQKGISEGDNQDDYRDYS